MSVALQNKYQFIFKTALMSLLHSNRELEMNKAEVLGENDSFAVCCFASTSQGTNKYIYVAYISNQRAAKYKQQFSILFVLQEQTAVLIYELHISVYLVKGETFHFCSPQPLEPHSFQPNISLVINGGLKKTNTNAWFCSLFKYPQLFKMVQFNWLLLWTCTSSRVEME